MLNIASFIDHSLLKPDATLSDIERLCQEARRYGFYSVCVNPCWILKAREFLGGSPQKVCTVIGFPLGASTMEVKLYEAMDARLKGAHELDIVMNIGLAKSGEWGALYRELRDIVIATEGVVHKIIIETGLLTEDEIKRSVEVVLKSGAEFVKTSTGFSSRGASLDDIKIIKEIAGDSLKIKASGGIKTLHQVLDFLQAGASRIGTSSGVKIMEELEEEGVVDIILNEL